MSRRRLLTAALAAVCLIALSASAVALAHSSGSHAKPATHHVSKKHSHKPCHRHHSGDGRMTPGARPTAKPLT
jgi:hypothetical protein